MCRGTLETELINAIREHVKRLKTDQHSDNCEGPQNK